MFDILNIFPQNIDSGYMLERVPTIYVLDQKYEEYVYACIPQLYYIKVGFKEVYISRTCLTMHAGVPFNIGCIGHITLSLSVHFTTSETFYSKMADVISGFFNVKVDKNQDSPH